MDKVDKVIEIGKKVFDKYNQLVVQPGMIAGPSVHTFTKGNMIFVVESGPAGLMGHSHDLYEVHHEHEHAIISFKMARTYVHEHDVTYFIAKKDNAYSIFSSKNDKLVNASTEVMLHSHSLRISEIFKDSVRIFSDGRQTQIISNKKYTFEIQMDEGILVEHIHNIHQIQIPKEKKFRKVEVAFILQQSKFHEHPGVYYIEKDEQGEFVIKCNKITVHTTTPDDKIHKHDHNIKLIRVTKRLNNKNVLLEDPVPDHAAREIYHAAKMIMQLT
jgi:hypothetical protein